MQFRGTLQKSDVKLLDRWGRVDDGQWRPAPRTGHVFVATPLGVAVFGGERDDARLSLRLKGAGMGPQMRFALLHADRMSSKCQSSLTPNAVSVTHMNNRNRAYTGATLCCTCLISAQQFHTDATQPIPQSTPRIPSFQTTPPALPVGSGGSYQRHSRGRQTNELCRAIRTLLPTSPALNLAAAAAHRETQSSFTGGWATWASPSMTSSSSSWTRCCGRAMRTLRTAIAPARAVAPSPRLSAAALCS